MELFEAIIFSCIYYNQGALLMPLLFHYAVIYKQYWPSGPFPPLQSSNLSSMYPASHPVSAGICPVSLELDEDNVIVQIYLLDAY